MITVNNKTKFAYGCPYPSEVANEYCGLAEDPKPMDAPNGSMFLEINTGKVFCFDKEHKTWCPW